MEVAQRLGQKVSFESCLKEWTTLEKDFEQCQNKHKEYRKTAELYNNQRMACKTSVDRQIKKMKSLKNALKKSEDDESKDQMLKDIIEREKSLYELQKYLPRKNGFYLSLIVGQMNMILDSVKEKYRYKDEYEKFKFYCSILMLFFSSLLYFFVSSRVPDALFSYLLLWYYCTLTIRENILIQNGSKIKGWYFIHHYVAVAVSAIFVLWSDQISYQQFRPGFMLFSMYQSCVQLMQCYYQRGCLYRLRALGERDDMDITGEGFRSWMWKGLTFLLPFLFIGQFWQLYNSYTLYTIAKQHNFQIWNVIALSLLFFVLFLFNFLTLISVLLQKVKKDIQLKKGD